MRSATHRGGRIGRSMAAAQTRGRRRPHPDRPHGPGAVLEPETDSGERDVVQALAADARHGRLHLGERESLIEAMVEAWWRGREHGSDIQPPIGADGAERENATTRREDTDPRRPGQRGRPRRRSPRLPAPAQLARDPDLAWRACRGEVRGRLVERLVSTQLVLWWPTGREAPVQLVVRDPRGRSQDTYLFTTDLMATAEQVIRADADRWAIEETHRSGKQFLGADQESQERIPTEAPEEASEVDPYHPSRFSAPTSFRIGSNAWWAPPSPSVSGSMATQRPTSASSPLFPFPCSSLVSVAAAAPSSTSPCGAACAVGSSLRPPSPTTPAPSTATWRRPDQVRHPPGAGPSTGSRNVSCARHGLRWARACMRAGSPEASPRRPASARRARRVWLAPRSSVLDLSRPQLVQVRERQPSPPRFRFLDQLPQAPQERYRHAARLCPCDHGPDDVVDLGGPVVDGQVTPDPGSPLEVRRPVAVLGLPGRLRVAVAHEGQRVEPVDDLTANSLGLRDANHLCHQPAEERPVLQAVEDSENVLVDQRGREVVGAERGLPPEEAEDVAGHLDGMKGRGQSLREPLYAVGSPPVQLSEPERPGAAVHDLARRGVVAAERQERAHRPVCPHPARDLMHLQAVLEGNDAAARQQARRDHGHSRLRVLRLDRQQHHVEVTADGVRRLHRHLHGEVHLAADVQSPLTDGLDVVEVGLDEADPVTGPGEVGAHHTPDPARSDHGELPAAVGRHAEPPVTSSVVALASPLSTTPRYPVAWWPIKGASGPFGVAFCGLNSGSSRPSTVPWRPPPRPGRG